MRPALVPTRWHGAGAALTAFVPTVSCSWSAWSPWGECLGPCGVQSIQWSFRSPSHPGKHGTNRQCRGIYRKARR